MTLLIAMLPLYVMGNLHCLGMCGPLAMLLGGSRFRGFYLLGRLVSFTLAGFIAGAIGQVIGIVLHSYHISAAFSVLLGFLMLLAGGYILAGKQIPFSVGALKRLAPLQERFHKLMYTQEPWPLFLFGFCTILLPCGQTLLVYSACALSGSAWVGLINGFAFGLITTPSLLIAMRARKWISKMSKWYRPIVGFSALFIGLVAVLRGLAEWGLISHLGIHPFMIY